jgi:hypothetical protein
MEIELAILGIIVAVITAVIPYLRKRFSERPRLEMIAKWNGGSSAPKGLSMRNEFVNGVVELEKAIQVFELRYRYILTIFNNSDQTAYYPMLYFDSGGYDMKVQELPPHPISNSAQIDLKIELVMIEEATGWERTDTSEFPLALEGANILLEYQNSHRIKFYTMITLSKSGGKTDLSPSKTLVKSITKKGREQRLTGLVG